MSDQPPELQSLVGGVDKVLASSDNDKQDGVDEVIKMSEQEPLHDKDCQHSNFTVEGDKIGDTVSVVCDDCPKGWYIPESEAEQLSKR